MKSSSSAARPASPQQGPYEQHVIIKVLRAELTKSVEKLGRKMDPFATVEWVRASGESTLLCKTPTLWDAHKNPVWDYTSGGQLYDGSAYQGLAISVYDDNHIRSPKLCGSAQISIDRLLGDSEERSGGVSYGPIRTLELTRDEKNTGSVSIQARLVSMSVRYVTPPSSAEGESTSVVRVDPNMFETPVKRLGVSGGTAPFFELRLKKPGPNQNVTHYIGKDLSHATDELGFYEQIHQLRLQPGGDGLGELLDFSFEYAGILVAKEEGVPASKPPMELLVMRNLRDGCAKLRMLDLKMGQHTAQAGWKGKSRSRAVKQGVLDSQTNSYAEGYRLEGFDGWPPALESRDPLMDLGGSQSKGKSSVKKAIRFMFQNMTGSEIFMHFVDLHQEPGDDNVDLTKFFGGAELSEIVLHEIVRRLTRLAVVCHKAPVPQKWIGSSVALGFDVGKLPPRSEKAIRSSVIVNIFDWGRSELNTIHNHEALNADEQNDRVEFWRFYTGGIDKLCWNAARHYLNRFGCQRWDTVTIEIFDYDSMSQDDILGQITVPVKERELETRKLPKRGSVSYSIKWRAAPQPNSRLQGSWRLFIGSASDLPGRDLDGTSDPYCLITAMSPGGEFKFQQVTSVKPSTLSPVWDETIDLPVAATSDALRVALEDGGVGVGYGNLHTCFDSDKPSKVTSSLQSSLHSSLRSLSFRRSKSNTSMEWSARLEAASIPKSSLF